MRDDLVPAFRTFSDKHEAALKYMYLDVLGKVTTAVGNLIDSVSAAQALPWQNADGSPSSPSDVETAWNAVHDRQDMATKASSDWWQGLTTIRLTDEGITSIFQKHLDNDAAFIRKQFPGYEDWPADAQIGIHSMAWAQGASFAGYPHFSAYLRKSPPDFTGASEECEVTLGGGRKATGSLADRNKANKQMFLNAAAVLANGGDTTVFYYPNPVPGAGQPPAQPPASQPGAGTGGGADPGADPGGAGTAAQAAGGAGGAGTAANASGAGTGGASGAGTSAADGSGDGSGAGSADGSGSGSGSGDAPLVGFGVEAYVTVDPDDGTSQHQQSVQVGVSAKLTLNWTATAADSVSISDVGDGLALVGAHPLETKDASYTVYAIDANGTKSVPVVITVTTHPDGDVVSPHSDLSSGTAAVISFQVSENGVAITHATTGDEVTFTLVVSESSESATINGAEVALVPTEDGHKSATAKATLDGSQTDFYCEALSGGDVQDSGSLHLDLAPAPASDPSGAPANDPSGAPANDPSGPPASDPSGAPANDPSGPPAPATDPTSAPPPATDPTSPAPAPQPQPQGNGSHPDYPNTPQDLRERYLHMKFTADGVDVDFTLDTLKYHNNSITETTHDDYILPNEELKNLVIQVKNKLKKDKGADYYAQLLGRFAEDAKMILPYPFIGKGSPAQIEAVLKILAVTNGAGLGHYWVDKGDINASLKDFYWNHMGLDCSGFAGNYARWMAGPEDDRIYSGLPKGEELNPEMQIKEFARIGKKRHAVEEIMMGDLICWASGSHISTILSHDGGTLQCVESNGDKTVKGLGAMERKVVFAGGDLWTLGGSESVYIVSFT